MTRFKLLCAVAAVLLPCVDMLASVPADTVEVATTLIPGPMKCTVIVPDSYYAEGDTAHYPVVYMLNGHGGDYRSWPELLGASPDSLASVHQAIFVCTDGRNSWYWDSPVDPSMQMESFFVQDLLPAIDSRYRTRPSREYRAITGLSMGGHGALWLALRHPDLFGSAGSMSGGVDACSFPENWHKADRLGRYEDNPQLWADHAVIGLVPSIEPGQVNLIVDCGYDDFFFDDNNRLHAALLERRIPHDYTIRPGGHTKQYWANSILYHLQFFGDRFKAAMTSGK